MLRVSTNIDATSRGDRKINGLISGDIQPGSLLLVAGESDTGKSILCRQLAYNLLCSSTCSVAYLTNHRRPEELLDQMESFSFHVHYHFVADRFRIYSLRALNQSMEPEQSIELLLGCLDDLTAPFNLAVIDDINSLLAGMSPQRQVGVLRDIKAICRKDQRSVIMVANPYVFARDTLRRLYSLSDYYLQTDLVPALPGLEQIDCRTMRTLLIGKMGGVEMAQAETAHFEIREGSGIHILPYVTVRT